MATTPCEKQIARLIDQLNDLGYPDVTPATAVDLTISALKTLSVYKHYVRLLYERQQMFGVLLQGLAKTVRATFLNVDLEQFRRDIEDDQRDVP